jgi:hypothetical protein
MFFRGQWEFCDTYDPGDVVVRADLFFLAIRQSAGEDPVSVSSENFWKMLAEDGTEELTLVPPLDAYDAKGHRIMNLMGGEDAADAVTVKQLCDGLQNVLDELAGASRGLQEALSSAASTIEKTIESVRSALQEAVDDKIGKSEGLLVDTYMTPAGFWTNIDPEGKARYATLKQSALAMFGTAIQGAGGEPVLFGHDPETGEITGYPLSMILGTVTAVLGGNPLIAIIDYPDGELLGGNPLMAVEDYYPYGHLYGGDPFTY